MDPGKRRRREVEVEGLMEVWLLGNEHKPERGREDVDDSRHTWIVKGGDEERKRGCNDNMRSGE